MGLDLFVDGGDVEVDTVDAVKLARAELAVGEVVVDPGVRPVDPARTNPHRSGVN
jgi:hypothetical protein